MTKGPVQPFPLLNSSSVRLLSFPGGLSGRFLTSGCRPCHAEHGAQPGGLPGSCNYWERLTPPPHWSPSSQPQSGCCNSIQLYRCRHDRGMRQRSHNEHMAGITESRRHALKQSVKLTLKNPTNELQNLTPPPRPLRHTHTHFS